LRLSVYIARSRRIPCTQRRLRRSRMQAS